MVGRRTRAVLVSVGLVLVSLVGGCDLFGDKTLAAVFTAQLDRDSAPATLTLDASTSKGAIVSYDWDVAGASHTGVTVSVVLPDEGEYLVWLTVTDGEGGTHRASKTFVIRPSQPDMERPIPGTLQLKTTPGQARSAPITLSNLGALPLEVTVDVTEGEEWLEVDAVAFSLPDATQEDLLVTATCGSALETRLGSIELSTNDLDYPEITIPVALVCTSVPTGSFDLQLRFDEGRFTASQRSIIEQAAARWEAVIVGDIDEVTGVTQSEVNQCNFGFAFTGTVDDMLILVTAEDIDGPGHVVGQGGPCWLRGGFPGLGLPYLGVIYLDTSDLADMESDGTLFAVVMHELAHSLGFLEDIWEPHDLLSYQGDECARSAAVFFTGADAVARWQGLGGTETVPVADYGSGISACSHWRTHDIGDELMTPTTGTKDALSTVTVASLDDLGYVVDYAAADPHALPGGESVRASAATRQTVADALPPVGWVAPDGTRHHFGESDR